MAITLRGLSVWDGLAAEFTRTPQSIRIEGERIVGIGPQGEAGGAPSAAVREIALDGAFALPGLVDAHVHLGLDPELRSPAEQLAVDPERSRLAMEARAAAMVEAGITTARDLGGGDYRELALRDRILAGEVPGPRLLCAGQPLTTPGGHCHFWGGCVRDRDEIAAVVRRQVEHGADWIKVMATGGVMTRGTDPGSSQFGPGDLLHIVEESRRHGRAVAAHCHATTGIRDAAHAGVRSIEHCSFAGRGGFGTAFDARVVEAIAAADAFVSPTVNAGWLRFIEREEGPSPFFDRMRFALESLTRAGVALIASTDAGIPGVAHHRLAEALLALGRYTGLGAREVLIAATSQSARALGLEGECGVLRPGLSADVLVVGGDPMRDLGVLREPRLVVARGRVASDRR